MARRPINSAARPHGRTAAGSLDQNDSGATNGPEIEARAAARAPDSTSQVSDRLEVLAELSVADLRLEWRRLFRADPPRLSRDIMMRAIAYRLQEIAHGGASKVTQRRLMTLTAEFETGGTIAPPSGPKIKPGSRLVREWHGRTHAVCVTEDGFEFEGKLYRSLTKHRPGHHGRGLVRTAVLRADEKAGDSGTTTPDLGKSDWDGGRAGDPSQCVEASDA